MPKALPRVPPERERGVAFAGDIAGSCWLPYAAKRARRAVPRGVPLANIGFDIARTLPLLGLPGGQMPIPNTDLPLPSSWLRRRRVRLTPACGTFHTRLLRVEFLLHRQNDVQREVDSKDAVHALQFYVYRSRDLLGASIPAGCPTPPRTRQPTSSHLQLSAARAACTSGRREGVAGWQTYRDRCQSGSFATGLPVPSKLSATING
jgi:hypothetical protein